MSGSNSLVVKLIQKEGDAELSTLTLSYPSLENAVANVLSFHLVEAVMSVLETWSAGKAELTGEKELFEAAMSLKGKKSDSMPKGVIR